MTEEIQKIININKESEIEIVELKKQLAELKAKEPEIIEKVVEDEVKSDEGLRDKVTFLLRCILVSTKTSTFQRNIGKLLDKLEYNEFLPSEIRSLSNLQSVDVNESRDIISDLIQQYAIR